jgi:hypothetical protein
MASVSPGPGDAASLAAERAGCRRTGVVLASDLAGAAFAFLPRDLVVAVVERSELTSASAPF